MTWNTENNDETYTIKLIRGAQTETKSVSGESSVGEELVGFAQEHGIKNFTVFKENGEELEQSDAEGKTMAEIGNLKMHAKAVGAQ